MPAPAGVILYQWLQGWVSGRPLFRTIVGGVKMMVINDSITSPTTLCHVLVNLG